MGKSFISALRLLETFPLLDMIGRDMDLRDWPSGLDRSEASFHEG